MPAAKPVVRTVRNSAPLPLPRRASTAGWITTVATVAVGGVTSSWLYLLQNNPVMAGIVALTSSVGAALAWVTMRR